MIRQFPLQWPEGWGRTPPGKRKEAQFKVPPGQGQKEMLKELSLLGARGYWAAVTAGLVIAGAALVGFMAWLLRPSGPMRERERAAAMA